MKIYKFSLPVLLLLSYMWAIAGSRQWETAESIYFGEAWDGNKIVISDNTNEINKYADLDSIPKKLFIVTSSGRICPVEFVRKFEPKQISEHQRKTGFAVFETKEKGCREGFPIVLATEEFLKDRVPLAVKEGSGAPLDKAIILRLEKSQKEKVYKSWTIANIEDGAVIALVQLGTKEKEGTSCLVLVTKEKIIFNYLNQPISEDESRWEDWNCLAPDVITINAAFKSPYGYEIVKSGGGHEGTPVFLLRQSGSNFQLILNYYFYGGY